MCIVYIGDKYGIATTDVTTGDFFVTEVDSERKLLDELNRFSPTEIICNEPFYMSGVNIDDMKERMGIAVSALDSWYFGDDLAKETLLSHFHVQSLEGLGLMDYDCGVIASAALLKYLYESIKAEPAVSNIMFERGYAEEEYEKIAKIDEYCIYRIDK